MKIIHRHIMQIETIQGSFKLCIFYINFLKKEIYSKSKFEDTKQNVQLAIFNSNIKSMKWKPKPKFLSRLCLNLHWIIIFSSTSIFKRMSTMHDS